MAKIQTSCPNCGQPLVADIFQVVDVKENPRLKELVLSGGLNLARCQLCGFQGQLPVPFVYHDRQKELLLTFTPPDAGKTMEEKESALAPLLKQITDGLEPAERKGYLFQPQAMLTMNNLIKNILMADGITEEMIESQQEDMRLLDMLLNQEGAGLKQAVEENKDKIDREFFALFAEIAQRVLASGDEQMANRVRNIQDLLLSETEVGRQIKAESEEIRAATKSLESLGNNLTRSSLLELIVAAPSRDRVQALGNLVGQAMDYEFFQQFTDRIEAAEAEQRNELVERRNMLLKISEDIRKQVEARLASAREMIERIIAGDSLEDGLLKEIGSIDQVFVEALSMELREAESKNDQERAGKLTQLLEILQKLTTPPEMKVVEGLLQTVGDPEKLAEAIENIEEEIAPRVIEYLTSIVNTYEEQLASGEAENKEEMEEGLADLKAVYNSLLRSSMEKKFKK